MDFKLISVGIADLGTARPPDILRTILGSCVGICLYDAGAKVAGMAHIMLPDQNKSSSNSKKYASSAIPLLVEEMEKQGARKERMTAKIAGGATMFRMIENSTMSEIGRNNVRRVKEILAEINIKILAEDIGGDYGRTIDFNSDNGSLRIKTIGKTEKLI